MVAHAVLGDAQPVGDLLVAQPLLDAKHDLQLALGVRRRFGSFLDAQLGQQLHHGGTSRAGRLVDQKRKHGERLFSHPGERADDVHLVGQVEEAVHLQGRGVAVASKRLGGHRQRNAVHRHAAQAVFFGNGAEGVRQRRGGVELCARQMQVDAGARRHLDPPPANQLDIEQRAGIRRQLEIAPGLLRGVDAAVSEQPMDVQRVEKAFDAQQSLGAAAHFGVFDRQQRGAGPAALECLFGGEAVGGGVDVEPAEVGDGQQVGRRVLRAGDGTFMANLRGHDLGNGRWPRAGVALQRFVEAALREGDRTKVQAREHAPVRGAGLVEGVDALVAAPPCGIERAAHLIDDAKQQVQGALDDGIGAFVGGGPLGAREHRLNLRGVQGPAAEAGHRCLNQQVVLAQGAVVAARTILGEAFGGGGQAPVQRQPFRDPRGLAEQNHAHQAGARKRLDHFGAEEALHRGDALGAQARPNPRTASLLDQLAEQRVVARLLGMAQRLHDMALQRLGAGDAPVHHGEPLRTLALVERRAVLAQHGVQAHAAGVVDLQQPIEHDQALDASPHVDDAEHVVGELRVDVVEQRRVEQESAVVRREVLQQPFAQPLGGHAGAVGQVLHGAPPAAGVQLHVPVGAQHHRPAFGTLFELVEFPARKRAAEEAPDVRLAEAQLIDGQVDAVAGEHRASEVEAGVFAQAQGDAEVGRRVLEQEVDALHRLRVDDLLGVVEHEQARTPRGLDGCAQILRPASGRLSGRAVVGDLLGQVQGQASLLERERQVGVQNAAAVLFVDGQPSGQTPGLPRPVVDVRQQGGLAESGRRAQHRQRSQRLDALDQIDAPRVALDQVRRLHLRRKQPRQFVAAGVGAARRLRHWRACPARR